MFVTVTVWVSMMASCACLVSCRLSMCKRSTCFVPVSCPAGCHCVSISACCSAHLISCRLSLCQRFCLFLCPSHVLQAVTVSAFLPVPLPVSCPAGCHCVSVSACCSAHLISCRLSLCQRFCLFLCPSRVLPLSLCQRFCLFLCPSRVLPLSLCQRFCLFLRPSRVLQAVTVSAFLPVPLPVSCPAGCHYVSVSACSSARLVSCHCHYVSVSACFSAHLVSCRCHCVSVSACSSARLVSCRLSLCQHFCLFLCPSHVLQAVTVSAFLPVPAPVSCPAAVTVSAFLPVPLPVSCPAGCHCVSVSACSRACLRRARVYSVQYCAESMLTMSAMK
nr:keratin-associated protein 10-11-like [Oryctolagus cuniculus]XP_051706922.1 keratin-associated protein 10-11-like [Oryctolagus cuniculus]XP_051706923.1 keratin-associated protein 10-11-like [Oryctolagus cuniculus]